MATASVTYYYGDVALKTITSKRNADVEARFPGQPTVKFDSFQKVVGYLPDADPLNNPDSWVPAHRRIEFKKFPSLHKCDARCTHAKGSKCECSCGGKFHGINR